MASVTVDEVAWEPDAPAPATVNGVKAWPVTLQRCNMNINQQWELGDDGVIGDIQFSIWALADLGDGKLYATNVDTDHLKSYNFWNYPDLDEENNQATMTVTPDAVPVMPGGNLHVVVSGLTTPTADVLLMKQIDVMAEAYDNAVIKTTLTADQSGTITTDIAIPADIEPARYQVVVRGLSYDMPGAVVPTAADGTSTAITTVDQLVVADGIPTLDNFRAMNRTTPVSAVSSVIGIGTSGQTPPAGPSTSSGVPAWLIYGGIGLLVVIIAAVVIVVVRKRGKKAPAEAPVGITSPDPVE